jgi:hypothetical protein
MTSRLISVLLVTTLVLPGCATARMSSSAPMAASSVRVHPPPRAAGDADVWRRFVTSLPVGSKIRVDLADGTRVTGTLMVVEDEAMIVNPRTRLPEPARRLAFSTIVSIEPQRNGIGVTNAVLIGVASGVASFFAMFVIAITALD